MLEDAQPVLVLGDSRRQSVIERLRACAQAWLREWVVPEQGELTVSLVPAQDAFLASAPTASLHAAGVVAASGPRLVATATDEGLIQALGLPRHCSFGNTDGLGARLADEMLVSLAGLVAKENDRQGSDHIEIARSSVGASWKDIAHRQHWWVANLSLEGHGVLAALWLSPRIMLNLAPHAAGAATMLERRASAILADTVHLQVILGEVHLSVGDLASLAVNDVLVLKEDLSHPAALVTMDGRMVARVSPGRNDEGKRAVSICG